MKHSFLITLSLCLLILSSCAQEKDYVVTIKTKYGDMVAILYDETPKHKKNFIDLAKKHYFDSLLFHRVIDGFMIQGGDPDSKKAPAGQVLGRGGPGYTVDAEINPNFFHERGALSAARLNDQQNPTKASSGSQFYIVHGTKMTEADVKVDQQKYNQALQQYFQNPAHRAVYDSIGMLFQTGKMKEAQDFIMTLKSDVEKETGISVEKEVSPEKLKAYTTLGGAPQLDGGYTVFGKVIKGMDVVDKIVKVSIDESNRPLEDVRMTVTVEELSKKKIEKLYGYTYPVKKTK